MQITRLLRNFKKSLSSYKPLIEIFISRDAIVQNLAAYQKAAIPVRIAPVIKSNAYGHGLIEVGSILATQDVPFIVIDSLYEARMLRHEGITTPLLVVGYTPTANIRSAVPKNTSITIGTIEQLQELVTANISATIHIKIDTGMHRQGLMPSDFARAIELLKPKTKVHLEGVCSHFADADGASPDFTNAQIATWNSAVKKFRDEFPYIRYWHLAASAGVRLGEHIDANVARLGKGLYGLNPVPSWPISIRPALEMQSVVSAIRTLPSGERIGYNGTFETKKVTRVATIPVGYYEGVDRRLSNTGAYTIHGIPCPILGRVSMNISSIDVSEIPEVRIGDTVTIISANPSAPNSVENIAKQCGTIGYEILVHLPAHLSRKVI